MAIMSTTPVLHCPRCGKLMIATHVETFHDQSGVQLNNIMRHLGEVAYCDDCRGAMNYYSKIGRIEDWKAGRP